MVKHADEISWHYPRPDLAQSYLSTLHAGLVASVVLFAPRRKGKTEFLLEDLIPAAQQAGYRVVYSSMWQNRADPLAALAAALTDAAQPKGFREKFKSRLRSPLSSASLEMGLPYVGKLKAETHHEDGAAPSASAQALLQQLPQLVDAVVAASGGKVLLAIDEVQHLAKPEFQEFVAALRTTLDVRKKTVKTVFTGSSRNRLQSMFSQIRSPLFQFSQATDFPDLGEGFVAYMIAAFHRATQRALPLHETLQAFRDTGATPGLFQDALERLMKTGGLDILGITHEVIEESRAAAGYTDWFTALRPLDREVVHAIIEQRSLYAEDTRRDMALALGIDEALTARPVQAAVERLLADQTIYKSEYGRYEIEDDQLAEWLKDVDFSVEQGAGRSSLPRPR